VGIDLECPSKKDPLPSFASLNFPPKPASTHACCQRQMQITKARAERWRFLGVHVSPAGFTFYWRTTLRN
jgi:hypothetical protein